MTVRHRITKTKAKLGGLSVPDSIEAHRQKLIVTYLKAVEDSSVSETKAAVRRIRDDPWMAVEDAKSETEARLRATQIRLEERGITTSRVVWTAILVVLSVPAARGANRIGQVLSSLHFQMSQGYITVGDQVFMGKSRYRFVD